MRPILASSLILAACHTASGPSVDAGNACLGETRADTFATNLDKPGTLGKLDFVLVSGEPAPPSRGDNTWIIAVNTLNAGVVGTPVDNAVMTALPFMPDHGHGTAIKVNISSAAMPGQYQLAPINMWMPGYWETTVHASSGGASDYAVFKFCIPN
jgi:hypothetical protein